MKDDDGIGRSYEDKRKEVERLRDEIAWCKKHLGLAERADTKQALVAHLDVLHKKLELALYGGD